eukprot:15151_1
MEDKQKLMDSVLTTINKCDSEQDTLEKISRTAKNEYKNQKIEIENQFEMIINMLKATQSSLLTQLEEKHKTQQNSLNNKISKYYNFVKKYRKENNEINRDNITQIADIHDRITKEYSQLCLREKYLHSHISVILDTSTIMNSIQKIAYIQEKTKEEMSKQKNFHFHNDNKNLCIKPQIIALNTNSLNTKICVSWKLNPSRSSVIPSNMILNDDDDTTTANTPTIDSSSRNRRNSVSMTDEIDTSNLSMNVHEICSIDIEWRYSDNKEELTTSNNKPIKYKWNILDVDHHKILAFQLDTSIFDHILNTTRYGIYYFRITLYNRNSKISSKEMIITTFKIKIRHIADEWNLEKKQKALRIGFFNRKIVTRDIPGKFRHIFGTLIISKGVNVWTLKIKKIDPNRGQSSGMIGVINMNQRDEKYNNKLKTLNQCFAHIGIGYGLYTTNGDVYHTKNPRTFGKKIKEGDIIQIMCDYRGHTISFIINNINWGIAFDRSHFPNQKMPNLGLVVALRGCDEIQLIDFINESQSLFPFSSSRRRSSSSTMIRTPVGFKAKNEKYGKLNSNTKNKGQQNNHDFPDIEEIKKN